MSLPGYTPLICDRQNDASVPTHPPAFRHVPGSRGGLRTVGRVHPVPAAIATLGLALAGLLTPAAALADTATSANWSGYVAHRSGISFRRIQASWTQPAATCKRGKSTYSAFWVGLGGFSLSSQAIEQIGTELDCGPGGRETASAWYESAPSPLKVVPITVKPRDRMSASVAVAGHRVTFRLRDLTRHESFSKVITAASVDTTSADWIAEAPSACTSTGYCEPLPLTDFGSMRFTAARVRTRSGRHGAISSGAWDTTKIVLAANASTFAKYGTASDSTPSALQNGGSAFEVRFAHVFGARTSPAVASSRPTAATRTGERSALDLRLREPSAVGLPEPEAPRVSSRPAPRPVRMPGAADAPRA